MKVLIIFFFSIIEACWPIDLDSDIHIGERKSSKNGRETRHLSEAEYQNRVLQVFGAIKSFNPCG